MKLKLPFSKRNDQIKQMPFCTVYFSESDGVIVTPAHHNFAGIGYEQDQPIVIASSNDASALGEAVREAFQRYSIRDQNLKNRKLSDWSGYRASGCKTATEFEEKYARIHVLAKNQEMTLADAIAEPPEIPSLSLTTLVFLKGEADEIGYRLQKFGRIVLNFYDRMEDLLD